MNLRETWVIAGREGRLSLRGPWPGIALASFVVVIAAAQGSLLTDARAWLLVPLASFALGWIRALEERADGTWHALRAEPVDLATMLLGALLGRTAVAGTTFMPLVALAILAHVPWAAPVLSLVSIPPAIAAGMAMPLFSRRSQPRPRTRLP